MATFPIQFAETLPTGRATAVRADIDVRTGAAEMARAVSGFGAALFESGQRIADAQKAMELSTFDRKEEEFRLSALQALKAPGFDINDDEAVAALKEKTNTDRDSLISKWKEVNNTYQMHRNRIDPQWNVQFEGAVQDIKARNVRDEFELNAEILLGKGRLLEYQTLLETALTTDVISKVEYDFNTKNAPNDSILQQMRIQIGQGNSQGAIALSGQMKDPSADQMEFRDRLLNAAGRLDTQQDRVDEELTGEFSERLRFLLEPDKGNPPTFEEIDASLMSVEAKDKMRAKLRVFDNYSEGELEEAFTDSGNVIADIYDRIDKGEITTSAQIKDEIGNRLHPDTANGIIDDIQKPYQKDTEQMFKRLFGWRPELGFDFEKKGWFLYEKAYREWKAEVKEQDLIGEKIIEAGRRIARPYFIEHLTNEMPSTTDIPRITELALGEEFEEEPLPEVITENIKFLETKEPDDEKDFEDTVGRLKVTDMERALKYYNKWQEKFK